MRSDTKNWSNVKDTYILKTILATKQLDEEKNPSNIIKPGHTGNSIENRRYSWSNRLGLPFSVFVACENPKTPNWLLEEMLHDWFGAWRVRCTDNNGTCSRETARDVPLGVQALGICFAANATANEIDPADFTKFTPTQRFKNYVVKKIAEFNRVVHTEGWTALPYGWPPCNKFNWRDTPEYSDRTKLGHEIAIKFNPKDMPKAFEMCKYKKTVFAVA